MLSYQDGGPLPPRAPRVGPPPPERRGILGILSRMNFDNRLGDPEGRVFEAIEARRARDRAKEMMEFEQMRRRRNAMPPIEQTGYADGGQIPSYQQGGQMYQYSQAPELDPYYSNLLGQMQQYGAGTMYGTPAQQAAWQGAQLYGMGTGPQTTQKAEEILMGPMTDYMSEYTQGVIDPQIRALQEQGRRSQSELLSQAALGTGGTENLRLGAMEGQLQQGLAQQAADITARGYEDAFRNAQQRQMQLAGGLASLGAQQQQQQLARLGLFGDAAMQQAMFPYQNIGQQVGITSQMGYQPTVYQGPTYQPGFWESAIGRVADFASIYPQAQRAGLFGKSKTSADQTQTSVD